MPAEFPQGMSERQGYLLTTFQPRSPDQVEWEEIVRGKAEDLLRAHGRHRRTMWHSIITDVSARFQEKERLERELPFTPIYKGFAVAMAGPTRGQGQEYERLNPALELYDGLPLLEAEASLHGQRAIITSTHPLKEAVIEKHLRALYYGSLSLVNPALFLPFELEDCDLNFHSIGWGKNNLLISPQGTGYTLKDGELELPDLARSQIEAVIDFIASVKKKEVSQTEALQHP